MFLQTNERNARKLNIKVQINLYEIVCHAFSTLVILMHWDRVVSIVTCYVFDGPGIKLQWGESFLHVSRLDLGPTQPHIQWVPGHSQW